MKTLSLVNLYKAEIKKNIMAQIKGGTDVKCICAVNNPYVSTREMGGPVTQMCVCNINDKNSATVQNKTGNQ